MAESWISNHVLRKLEYNLNIKLVVIFFFNIHEKEKFEDAKGVIRTGKSKEIDKFIKFQRDIKYILFSMKCVWKGPSIFPLKGK